MHVALLEDVKALGLKGANVDVPDGYALNFLFPQHLAIKVAENSETDKDEIRRLEAVKREVITPEQKLAGELDGVEVVIQRTLKNGVLDTPVTATEVRASLKELGYAVSKRAIEMVPITTLGTEDVHIVLGKGFDATITVVVESAA